MQRSSHTPVVLRLVPTLDFGGVESRLLLQSSREFPRNYQLRICTLSNGGRAATQIAAEGIPVDNLGMDPSPRSSRTTAALTSYLACLKPDILHSSIAEANFHGALAGSMARVRARICEEVGMPNHGHLARLAYGLLYRTCSQVVAVTDASASYLRTANFVPAHRVARIYNCAHPRFFPRPAAEPRAWGGGTFTFLAVGRLTAVKNHHRLLNAFKGHVAQFPDSRLRILGSGELAPSLRSELDRLELAREVSLEGYASDVRPSLIAADAYVLPSLHEGCSISLIEACASAVPSLGSRVPGIVEVLGPYWASRACFDPLSPNAIKIGLDWLRSQSNEERSNMAQSLQDRAYTLFSPTRYLGELEKLYNEVLGSRPTGG